MTSSVNRTSDFPSFFKLLWSLSILFVLGMTTYTSAANLVESGSKLSFAHEIGAKYVVPLGLEEKTGSQALEKILVEGFRCGVVPVSPIGLKEPPRLECSKKPSGYAPLCDELLVTLRFEPIVLAPSRAEMLSMLDIIKVHSALPFCPYEPEVSAEYLVMRQVGEARLAELVESLGLKGNAKGSYDKLMVEGFYCGFSSNNPNDSISATKLICTKKPSGIKFCLESRVVMNVDWDESTSSKNDLFKELNKASITSVESSSCEIPAKIIENNSHF
jgi:hypothetical protein